MAPSTIRTEDGVTLQEGDRCFDYYNGRWGVIERIDSDGWFTHRSDARTTSLNGERVCVRLPRSNPFYATWIEGV